MWKLGFQVSVLNFDQHAIELEFCNDAANGSKMVVIGIAFVATLLAMKNKKMIFGQI